ncbi:hypothetical protein M0R89_11635 [Halorussus limi]|uniref:Uncharacterized protein n=1 Tax=Halorussus limi TaxID=2938695 RepID=A0A8U0HQP7_9EURY|nr:hypothetical protein [Halorussus limi]UPV73199.1 hypothetical protein M0R89_11635 [Halorussus limi]
MSGAEDLADELLDVDTGDRLRIVTNDVTVWADVGPIGEQMGPEKDDHGWLEGEIWFDVRVDDEYVEENGFVLPDARVSAKTKRGEWQQPTVVFAEEWEGNASSAEEVDNPVEDWEGEMREIDRVTSTYE